MIIQFSTVAIGARIPIACRRRSGSAHLGSLRGRSARRQEPLREPDVKIERYACEMLKRNINPEMSLSRMPACRSLIGKGLRKTLLHQLCPGMVTGRCGGNAGSLFSMT
jgi:hypothetical protein